MRARTLAILLALVMLVPAAAAATTLAFVFSNSTAHPATAFQGFDSPGTSWADFNGDGIAEMVSIDENRAVYVWSSQSPTVLAEIHPPYPSGWGARAINEPSVGDVDNNGQLDIIVPTSAEWICDYEFTPAGSTATHFSFVKKWCTPLTPFGGTSAGGDAGVWLEDVNGDGKMEIFGGLETRGLYALNSDGKVRWAKDLWGGNAGPTVTDLDGDGKKEVVYFGDGGEVRAFDASSGAQKYGFCACNYVHPASIPEAGAIADIDGDGTKEVVFAARNAPKEGTVSDYQQDHLGLFVLSNHLALKWWTKPSFANPLSYAHPVLFDVNGDGKKEIIIQDWNTIGHIPGNWERLGPGNVFEYSFDGKLKWTRSIDPPWSNDDVALADADGDGAMEILANGAYGQVLYLNAATGVTEQTITTSGRGPLRGPFAGDFNGDGSLDWGVSAQGSDGGGYVLFHANVPCRVAYGGWQDRDPCHPLSGNGGGSPPPPPPPPPPPGDFTATFPFETGNNWWVEVRVEASQPLASVEARVNGGAWIALPHQSWGNWAKSFNVPTGATVDFRATSTSGESVIGGASVWPPGSAPPPPPPPPGNFTATFPFKTGNNWWVEVHVDASEPLAGVDARVNGGAWIALPHQSWGNWAKSFNVPTGATVEFRATSTSGGSVIGGATVWPPGSSGGGGGGGGAFTATFTGIQGNEWWVQVNVGGSESIIAVDARVNGGSWIPLTHQSWGGWAKSFHVAPGSTVDFRAHGSSGATATGGSTHWPPP